MSDDETERQIREQIAAEIETYVSVRTGRTGTWSDGWIVGMADAAAIARGDARRVGPPRRTKQ